MFELTYHILVEHKEVAAVCSDIDLYRYMRDENLENVFVIVTARFKDGIREIYRDYAVIDSKSKKVLFK